MLARQMLLKQLQRHHMVMALLGIMLALCRWPTAAEGRGFKTFGQVLASQLHNKLELMSS